MDFEKNNLALISSIGAGLAGGLIMAAILLTMLNMHQFQTNILSIATLSLLSCCLPWCLDFLKNRGISLAICETITIVISCLVAFLYVRSVAQTPDTFDRLLNVVISYHGLALLFNSARLLIKERVTK